MSKFIPILSTLAFEGVALYIFFFGIAGVSPAQVVGVTVIIAVVGLLAGLRLARMGYELSSRGGDPILRAERNKARERRGF